MIRRIAALTLCLCCAAAPVSAQELLFAGKVVAGESIRLCAPYGGTVESISVRVGEQVSASQPIAQIASERFFSPMDGTVRGVDAQPGDSAQKTLFSIAPVSKYTISASVDKAYASVETKYITVGEQLYISCSKDGTHRAQGVVVAVDGSDFTVETDAGELYMEEKVYLYRSDTYEKETRVGYGAVARTKENAISASGSLLALHVEEGEFVERGELLFETVEGTFDAGCVTSGTVSAPQTGVIGEILLSAGETIAQDAAVALLYPSESFRIEISVPEEWMNAVHEGDSAQITLYAGTDAEHTQTGSVSSVDFVREQAADGSVSYRVWLEFEADAHTRLGMSAAVVFETGE